MVLIKNWEVVPLGSYKILHGFVFSHPRFSEGSRIYTSRVVELDEVNGVVQTLNTTYQLEERAV